MTLSAQIGRTIFTGNGSTTQFSYGQRFYDPSELKVVHYDTTTLTETALTGGQYDLDYSGASPYNSATITYPLTGAPMAATEQLIVYRSPALTQDADLTNQSAYFLSSLENQLDQLTTFVQNMQDQLNRALVLPVSTPTGKKITMGPPVGEAVLRWPDDVSGDCVLESVDIIDLIIDDSRTQQVIELAFEGQLFNDAWAREFGLVCAGALNTGFNADQVDGYDVLAGTTPASGLLKVGDYGVGGAIDISGMDLDNLSTAGSYHGDTLTNAPFASEWFIDVITAGTEITQRAAEVGNAEIIYSRAYNSGGAVWSEWFIVWAGASGSLLSGLNADQVDGYDVDSSPVPNAGLVKVGDWGATWQTLDFSGFSMDINNTVNFHGTNLGNAPDTGKFFVTTLGDGTDSVQTASDPVSGEVRRRYNTGGAWSAWSAPFTFDDHTHTEVDITDLDKYTQGEIDTALGFKADLSLVGAASGICPLDAGGLVDSAYLPSYVDDVIEAADYASLPGTGETGKIYVTLDNGNIYRWTGAAYIEINTSVGTADEAIALATPRNIALGGDATGSANFDGTANITITANVLDSEALGGVAAANYLRSDVADSVGGVLTFAAAPVLNNNVLLSAWDTSPALRTIAGINGSNQVVYGNTNLALALFSNGTLTHNGATVWTSGNDGLGSALDAGLLGGALPSAYATLAGTQTFSGVNTFTANQTIIKSSVGGVAPNSNADNLVLEESGDTVGLTIKSDNNETGQILFADSDSNSAGYVRYTHSSDTLTLSATGSSAIFVNSSGLLFGTNTVYHTGNDNTLVKTSETQTIGGNKTLTGNTTISNTFPVLDFNETDTSKTYRLNVSSGGFSFRGGNADLVSGNASYYFSSFNENDVSTFVVRSGGAYQNIYHTGNDSALAKLAGTQTFSGVNTYSNASAILLNNSCYLRAKDTSGNSRGLLGMFTDNVIYIGNPNNSIGLASPNFILQNNQWIQGKNTADTITDNILGVSSGTDNTTVGSTQFNTNIRFKTTLTCNDGSGPYTIYHTANDSLLEKVYRPTGSTAEFTTSSTLTAANLKAFILGIGSATAANINLTLPTEASTESYFSSMTDETCFQFSVANNSSTYSATIVNNGWNALYGNMVVAASASAMFGVRKISTGNWIFYRIA